MQGLENIYVELGWLLEWVSFGYWDCMIGLNLMFIIVDVYFKGVEGYDVELLFDVMFKNVDQDEGCFVQLVGWAGVDYYNKLGYVFYDVGINENVACILEYVYVDFILVEMACVMGKEDVVQCFYQ